MKRTCTAALALCLAVGIQSTAVSGQSTVDPVLSAQVGTWQATVTVFEQPGHPGKTYSGITTNTLGCGGRCLISEYNSQVGGQPFDGHGITAYDEGKQKYIETWTDAMSPGISTSEYTYNTVAKTFTGTMTTTTRSGQPVYMKLSGDYKSASQRSVNLSRTVNGQDLLMVQCAMVLITQ